MSLLDQVPTDVWIEIFHFLSVKDLGRVAKVCRLLNQLSEDDKLWRPRYEAKFQTRQISNAIRTDENRGWKIRYRLADIDLPLHSLMYGGSYTHKLCVHCQPPGSEEPNQCFPDPFWIQVIHHSTDYKNFIAQLHVAINDKRSGFQLSKWSRSTGIFIQIKYLKCLVVGNPNVGKRTTLFCMAKMKSEEPPPRNRVTYDVHVMIHGTVVCYKITVIEDLAELSNYSGKVDVLILCYSVADRSTFKDLLQWKEAAMKKSVHTQMKTILLATHLDLALDKNVNQNLIVSFREADRMAQAVGASLYREVSNKSLNGLADLFVGISDLFVPTSKERYTSAQKKCIVQ